MLDANLKKDVTAPQAGITLSLAELIQLRFSALEELLPSKKRRLSLNGETLTTTRGRGLDFDTTRAYQPGDDIRSMAWRVTARSLLPHLKVYHEEKEQAAWLAIDLSPSLYFGTRCMFKSTRSLLHAALTGWVCLQQRKRVGALINSQLTSQLYPPKASETYFLTILKAFAASSQALPHAPRDNYLAPLLSNLIEQARGGCAIHLYSDFAQIDEACIKLLRHLAQRTQLVMHMVYDPFEVNAPPPQHYVLTDGRQEILFNMQDPKNRARYQQQFYDNVQQLKDLARQNQVQLLFHGTDTQREVAL